MNSDRFFDENKAICAKAGRKVRSIVQKKSMSLVLISGPVLLGGQYWIMILT